MKVNKSESELRQYLFSWHNWSSILFCIIENCVIISIAACFLYKYRHETFSQLIKLPFFWLWVAACIESGCYLVYYNTILIKSLMERIHRLKNDHYDEEMIDDFENADSLFDNEIKIGEKYLFMKGCTKAIHLEDCCDIKIKTYKTNGSGTQVNFSIYMVYDKRPFCFITDIKNTKKDYYKFAKKMLSGNSKLMRVLPDVRQELINLDVLDDPDKKDKEKAERRKAYYKK